MEISSFVKTHINPVDGSETMPSPLKVSEIVSISQFNEAGIN